MAQSRGSTIVSALMVAAGVGMLGFAGYTMVSGKGLCALTGSCGHDHGAEVTAAATGGDSCATKSCDYGGEVIAASTEAASGGSCCPLGGVIAAKAAEAEKAQCGGSQAAVVMASTGSDTSNCASSCSKGADVMAVSTDAATCAAKASCSTGGGVIASGSMQSAGVVVLGASTAVVMPAAFHADETIDHSMLKNASCCGGCPEAKAAKSGTCADAVAAVVPASAKSSCASSCSKGGEVVAAAAD